MTRSSHLAGEIRQSREIIMDINPDKLNAFMGKMLGDVGAAINASLMLIGDKLGLYRTLEAKGPLPSQELAQATNTAERYVREWLAAQAASGYVEYDKASGKFSMTPEQNMVFGDEGSPGFMGAVGGGCGGSGPADVPRRAEDFRSIQDRQGRRLEPAQRMPVLWNRALLSYRL